MEKIRIGGKQCEITMSLLRPTFLLKSNTFKDFFITAKLVGRVK